MNAPTMEVRPPAAAVLGTLVDAMVSTELGVTAEELGVEAYVLDRLLTRDAPEAMAIAAGLDELAERHPGTVASAEELLRECEQEDWFAGLARLVAEGVYANPGNGGNRNAAAWSAIGYEHRLPEGPDGPPRVAPRPLRFLGHNGSLDFDAIVVGAGAAGGIVAQTLAEAGQTVLLLERGYERGYAEGGHRDHLRNQRYSRYGMNTDPDLEGNPRVGIDPEGRAVIARPHEWAYHHSAGGVGSGTTVFGGLAWRYHPDDFRMASRYGVPKGSSLVDWPIGYDDLEPWYDKAEHEIGVAGEAANPHEGHRSRDYPMPPLPRRLAGDLLAAGARRLGLNTFRPPLLVNSVPHDGRAACIECGSCVGFHCPSDAKNGTHLTAIPRALATGRCHLVTGAMVTRIEHGADGRVTGVRFMQHRPDGQVVATSARARMVVLSAGAIETARLLLASRSALYPNGIGNTHDQVGRHLQGHYYPTAFGLFDEEVHGSRGPGVTIATCDFNHGNPGIIGGAMLADDFVMPPIMFWETALPPGLPRWGPEAHRFMRENFRRVLQIKGPVHEIPNPDCRVDLGPIADRWGMPVARLSGSTHAATVDTARFILGRAREWLEASGARDVWGAEPRQHMSAGQHQAGTCRMGTDPKSSVTDSFGRVWDHDNLFVSDASLHPTNGGFNPVLTIMALAFRNADHIARFS
jgi:choline dehydrogenase-like flavoprotein